ncbi:hypothetical protein GF345_02695 [Candidatus Woesearchaeota archaeon]|nr:hypothetical protein [Candidatus Woesearchaeota archaeon]
MEPQENFNYERFSELFKSQLKVYRTEGDQSAKIRMYSILATLSSKGDEGADKAKDCLEDFFDAELESLEKDDFVLDGSSMMDLLNWSREFDRYNHDTGYHVLKSRMNTLLSKMLHAIYEKKKTDSQYAQRFEEAMNIVEGIGHPGVVKTFKNWDALTTDHEPGYDKDSGGP